MSTTGRCRLSFAARSARTYFWAPGELLPPARSRGGGNRGSTEARSRGGVPAIAGTSASAAGVPRQARTFAYDGRTPFRGPAVFARQPARAGDPCRAPRVPEARPMSRTPTRAKRRVWLPPPPSRDGWYLGPPPGYRETPRVAEPRREAIGRRASRVGSRREGDAVSRRASRSTARRRVGRESCEHGVRKATAASASVSRRRPCAVHRPTGRGRTLPYRGVDPLRLSLPTRRSLDDVVRRARRGRGRRVLEELRLSIVAVAVVIVVPQQVQPDDQKARKSPGTALVSRQDEIDGERENKGDHNPGAYS